jgi:hypothetical protein
MVCSNCPAPSKCCCNIATSFSQKRGKLLRHIGVATKSSSGNLRRAHFGTHATCSATSKPLTVGTTRALPQQQCNTDATSKSWWVSRTLVIGSGIAGLMAAFVASKSSREVVILECDPTDLSLQSLGPASNTVLHELTCHTQPSSDDDNCGMDKYPDAHMRCRFQGNVMAVLRGLALHSFPKYIYCSRKA